MVLGIRERLHRMTRLGSTLNVSSRVCIDYGRWTITLPDGQRALIWEKDSPTALSTTVRPLNAITVAMLGVALCGRWLMPRTVAPTLHFLVRHGVIDETFKYRIDPWRQVARSFTLRPSTMQARVKEAARQAQARKDAVRRLDAQPYPPSYIQRRAERLAMLAPEALAEPLPSVWDDAEANAALA